MRRNPDAERALLGVAMGDSLVAARVAELLPDMFSDPGCRATQEAIQRLVKSGRKVDLVTVSTEVQRDIAEPEMMLVDMLGKGFLPSMAGEYIALLEDAHKRRVLYKAAVDAVADTGDPAKSVETIEASLTSAMRVAQTETGLVSMAQALKELRESMDVSKKTRRQTGVADLDRLTGGFFTGQLIYIGARPGVGKSALGLAISAHVASKGGRVLYVTLEMGGKEMAARIMAAESMVDLRGITTGDLTPQDYARMEPLWEDLKKLPLYFDQKASTPLQIRKAAVQMLCTGGLALIAVDYIQLLSSGKKHNSRYEEVTSISRDLKLLATELNLPVVCMCQLNRNSERGFGKTNGVEPSMAEARDSGAIEQDANMFLTLYEPPAPPEDPQGREIFQTFTQAGLSPLRIKVEKNRQGPKGVVNVGFDKPHMRFLCIRRET